MATWSISVNIMRDIMPAAPPSQRLIGSSRPSVSCRGHLRHALGCTRTLRCGGAGGGRGVRRSGCCGAFLNEALGCDRRGAIGVGAAGPPRTTYSDATGAPLRLAAEDGDLVLADAGALVGVVDAEPLARR